MIKPELYHKTVGILFDAYFNDTLVHGNCYACAVGNLVAANMNYNYCKDKFGLLEWKGNNFVRWPHVFMTSRSHQVVETSSYNGDAKIQIDSTGYTLQELARIEYSFETAEKGVCIEDRMFNGLSAVLEVLKDIHQVMDDDLIQGNNKRFADHYQKRVSTV